MKVDSYYEIGKTHVVCQDRALHGESAPNSLYAVGSDGCSGSKTRTELGASLLCEITRNQLEIHGGGYSCIPFKNAVLEDMRRFAATLRLPIKVFDATLWVITSYHDGISVSGWGDGIVHLVYEDGSTETEHVEFTSGMPRYLSYELDPARWEAYRVETGERKATIHHYKNGELQETSEHDAGNFFYHDNVSMRGRLKSVTVFSDGACTYFQEALQLPLIDVVKELTDYKSYAGTFVSRRMLRLLDDHRKINKTHHDDLFVCTMVNV